MEICKTIKKIAKEDIRKHNLDEIRETIEASKSLKKVRRTHNLGKNRMITLPDKQGREIQEQDKIMERIEELFDSDQAVTICMYVCITFISDSAIQDNIVIQCWGP